MTTILCDLDGTLLRKTERTGPHLTAKRQAVNEALAAEFDLPGIDFLQGMEHGLTDWLIAEGAVRAHRPDVTLDGPAWKRVCARAEALFQPEPPGDDPDYHRLPGVPDTLLALKASGHRLGIVTGNISFFAMDKLAQAGIERALFNGPCAFGDHGKERHQILRTAVVLAGADASCLVLGDTVHDLAGARAAGLPFVGVGTSGLGAHQVADEPGAIWVADLSDPVTVLELIGRVIG